MPDDKRPNPRFAAVALEMSGEIEPPPSPPSTAPQLLVDGDGSITCPRCTFKAFVPISNREVVCVGCSGNPWYALPDGINIGPTPPYRCDSCGGRRPVTMTLSEVNLHCVDCKRLTLHVKQIDANEVRRERFAMERGARQLRMPEQLNRWLESKLGTPADERRLRMPDPELLVQTRDYSNPVPPKWNFKAPLRWRSESNDDFNPFTPSETLTAADEALRDLSSRVSSETRENTRALERVVTERMRVDLGLADFDVFAKTRRETNAAAVIRGEYSGNDIARRTGRTTRGLLEVIAKCSLERWVQVWVRSSSERHDKELCGRAAEMIATLMLDYPREVRIMAMQLPRDLDDVGVYLDHTYYEQRARPIGADFNRD